MGIDRMEFPTMGVDTKVERLRTQLCRATGGEVRKVRRRLGQAIQERDALYRALGRNPRPFGG